MLLSDLIRVGFAEMSSLPGWAILLSKVTVLLAAAWLVHFALARVNPRWRVLLWRGVTVGLVLLMVWSFGLPEWEVSVAVPQVEVAVAAPASVPTEPAISATELPPESVGVELIEQVELAESPAEFSVPVSRTVRATDEPAGVSLSWQTIVLIVWLLGGLLLLARLATGYVRLARFLSALHEVPDWVLDEVQSVAAVVGGSCSVSVRSSEAFGVPFVCGLWRPVLVLPERMCEPDCRSQLRAVLAHELAHVASSDFRWNVVIELATILLWLHPLVWRMGAAHRAACDGVCDAVSASYLGDVHGYCRTLAQVALEATAQSAPIGLAMARTCDVRRRIGVLQRRVFGAALGRRAVVSFVLTGLVGLVLLAGLRIALAVGADETDVAASQSVEGVDEAASRSMEIHVVDTEGKPIDGAGITVRVTGISGPVRYRSDADGNATVELPDTAIKSLQLLVWTDRHVTEGASWRGEAVAVQPPKENTFTLEPGSVLGGIVLDGKGKPIAGAEVTVHGRRTFNDSPRWRSINDTVTSDGSGKWLSRRVPKDLKDWRFTVEVKHPKFMRLELFEEGDYPIEELRKGNAEAVMREGIVVEGSVTDPSGKPVSGALVGQFVEQFVSAYPRTTSDEHGRYRLPPCEPGPYVIAVAADGYAPTSRQVDVNREPGPLDLQLREGAPIRLRVVDEEGQAIVGATVSHLMDQQILFLDNTLRATSPRGRNFHTDSDGRWSRLWVSGDELIILVSKDGYETVQKRLAPDEKEQVVTLKAGGWSVVGRVVDEMTKAPITDFRVTMGLKPSGPGEPHLWYGSEEVSDTNGEYRAKWDRENERRVMRIEADGYYASEAQPVGKVDEQVTFNVEMRRGPSIAGVVRGLDGKLLSGADVVLCTPGRGLYLRNGQADVSQHPLLVQTGADGRFSFPPVTVPYLVVAMRELGFAQVFDKKKIRDITLQAWARVEGRLLVGGKPAPMETIRINFDDLYARPYATLSLREQAARRIYHHYDTQTDENGRFVFDRVSPGSAHVCRQVRLSRTGDMSSWRTTNRKSVELVAGQTVHVELEGIDQDEARRRTPAKAAKEERARRVDAAMIVLDARPRASLDQRIEAAIEVLRNYSISKNEEAWARVFRELIQIGKPAVPTLTDELDRTTRNETLRALGFVLRGIGDPRSVPAMIRVIPRLYPGRGSDFGLLIQNDSDLLKFMQEHDTDSRSNERSFILGRVIREVMPALEKITGESHGWMELNSADHKGSGIAQHRMKSQAFLQHAQRWADWWEKSWQDFVANESEAQLAQIRESLDACVQSIADIPLPEERDGFPCGVNVTQGGGMRSYTVRLFDEAIMPGLYDFDTGRQPIPPQALLDSSPGGEPSKELLVWAEQEGVDLVAIKTELPGSDKPVYAFQPLGMKVWRIPNDRYDDLQNELRYRDKIVLPDPWKGVIAQIDETSGRHNGALTASFLFMTKNGVCGALRLEPPLSREFRPGMPSPRDGGWRYSFIAERYEGE